MKYWKPTSLDVVTNYFGQLFFYTFHNGVRYLGRLDNYNSNGFICGDFVNVDTEIIEWVEINDVKLEGDFKLILKKGFTDMQEEAAYYGLTKKIHLGNTITTADTAKSLHYATTKGYDMFDLIENGEAIYIKNIDRRIKNLINKLKTTQV